MEITYSSIAFPGRDKLMVFRIFLFLIGFGFSVAGGVSTIAYLNLLTIGKDIREYLLFVSQRIECYLLPIGMIIIWISIYFPFPDEKD